MSDFLIAAVCMSALAIVLVWLFALRKPKMFKELDHSANCHHDWEYVYFASLDEVPEEVQAKGSKAVEEYVVEQGKTKRQVCMECGFIAGTSKMVTAKYLKTVRAQLEITKAFRAEQEARKKVVDNLEREFFEAEVESQGLLGKEVETLLAGYKLYAKFVEQLPELMERYELMQVLEKLRTEEKGGDLA